MITLNFIYSGETESHFMEKYSVAITQNSTQMKLRWFDATEVTYKKLNDGQKRRVVVSALKLIQLIQLNLQLMSAVL